MRATSPNVSRRALTAWKAANTRRATPEHPLLEPIGLHECQDTFASLMIAAGVNAKALLIYMGHASVMTTLDRYGHLMPGNEEEAAGLLDEYLARQLTVNVRVWLLVALFGGDDRDGAALRDPGQLLDGREGLTRLCHCARSGLALPSNLGSSGPLAATRDESRPSLLHFNRGKEHA